jgi:hypothetical protein
LVGADATPAVGETFVATGVGTGTGTARAINAGYFTTISSTGNATIGGTLTTTGAISGSFNGSIGATTANAGYFTSIKSTPAAINASDMVTGMQYTITSLGTSVNWNAMGADATPAVGEIFVKNSTAYTGTGGTATPSALYTTGTVAVGDSSSDQLIVNATPTFNVAIPVSSGGTGVSTLTRNALVIGAGTSAVTAIAPSTNGNVLVSTVGSTVTAGSFVVGAQYTILTVGTTSFTAIGASANTIGIVFTATGVGSGTGTATTNLWTSSAVPTASTAVTLTTTTGSAPSWVIRAYVNFDASGTITIRQSSNISSITDGGVGRYVLNFTTAMGSVNYACVGCCGAVSGRTGGSFMPNEIDGIVVASTTTTQPIYSAHDAGGLVDPDYVDCIIIGN